MYVVKDDSEELQQSRAKICVHMVCMWSESGTTCAATGHQRVSRPGIARYL